MRAPPALFQEKASLIGAGVCRAALPARPRPQCVHVRPLAIHLLSLTPAPPGPRAPAPRTRALTCHGVVAVGMGACMGKSREAAAEEKRNADVDKKNKEDADAEASKIKLLLLGAVACGGRAGGAAHHMARAHCTGAGESGKSTIFKQMKILYGVGFGEEERVTFKPVVFNNVIKNMKDLIQARAPSGLVMSHSHAPLCDGPL